MDLRRDARIVLVAALVAGGAPGVALAQAPTDSYYNFILGRQLEGDGKATDALVALERAATADPKSAEIRAEIASLQLRRNLRDESEKAAKQALTLDDQNFEANRVLGLLYASNAASDRITEAQTEQFVRDSIKYLERAVAAAQGPPDPNLNFTLGRMYTVSGQAQKGIDALKRVIEQSPYSVQARMALAQAYASSGDLRSAIGTLEEVADDSPQALSEMGQYQMSASLYKDAIQTYTRGLAAQPNNRDFKRRRILAAFEDKQYQQAAAFAAEAQAQDKNEPTFPRLQASALLKTGNVPQAIAILEASAQQFHDADTQFMLADVYNDNGRSADAEKTLRTLLAASPNEPRVLNYLGYLLAQNGHDLDEAIRLVNRALQGDPGRAEYLDSLGWAYYKRGDLNEAEKYLSEAAQKRPDHPEILDHLGDLYAKRGRWQDAISVWTQAIATKEEGIEPAVVQKKIDDARTRVGR
jgi:tetratricopeptide (TPR) repeat protein